jgi:hypothetical protein
MSISGSPKMSKISLAGVLQVARHVEVGVHACLEYGDATELVEFGGVRFVVEGAGDQDVEVGIARFARRRHEVGPGDGAELRPDEDVTRGLSAPSSPLPWSPEATSKPSVFWGGWWDALPRIADRESLWREDETASMAIKVLAALWRRAEGNFRRDPVALRQYADLLDELKRAGVSLAEQLLAEI